MTCDYAPVQEYLDGHPRGAPPPEVASHLRTCGDCRALLEMDGDLRADLGAAAASLSPQRRAALVDRVAPRAAGRRSGWAARLSWGAVAAAAAVVVAALALWPEPTAPVSPSLVFGDLLGPMMDLVPAPAAETPAPAAEEEEIVSLTGAASSVWEGLSAPLSIAVTAWEAPRVAAVLPSAPSGEAEPASAKGENQ